VNGALVIAPFVLIVLATVLRSWLLARETEAINPHLTGDLLRELDDLEWDWPEREAA
jgi:hypothetical protein